MEKWNKNQINIGVAGVVFFLGTIFFLNEKPNTNPAGNNGSKITYRDLDKARKNEEVKSHFQREKVHVENFKQAPQINESYHKIEPVNDHTLRLEASVGAAAKDIAESQLHGMAMQSLENRINQKLLNEQKAAQMSAFQKKQFAEAYKKRALSMGYEVELNDNLEVMKVRKVGTGSPAIKSSPVIDVDSTEEDEESYD